MAKRLPSMRSTADAELADAARPELHRTHTALLAQSRHRAVREAIAHRDDIPLGVQASLANDDWHEVRAAIAANPRAAWSVMDALSRDRHHVVLLALITNPNLPHDIAQVLAEHKRPEVREALAARVRHTPLVHADHGRSEDHLIPELRERASSWAEHAGPGHDQAADAGVGTGGLDEAQAASLGAAARAATPAASGSAVPSADVAVPEQATVPERATVPEQPVPTADVRPALAEFEPGPSDPLDEFDRPAAASSHPGHDFLVVSLPDDLGPSRATAPTYSAAY